MSATAAKRPLELQGSASFNQEAGSAASSSTVKQDPSAKKAHSSKSKGKQVLDEETRNKRTAQNRAAQRAFRERKERKMKELQEKVTHLQEIQKQSEVESEFLRGQLFTLVKELKRFRPETSNDSEVLNYLAKHEVNDSPQQQSQTQQYVTPPDSAAAATAAATAKVQQNIQQKMNFSFSYPFNPKDPQQNNIPSPDGSSTYSTPNQQGKNDASANKSSFSSSSSSSGAAATAQSSSDFPNNNFFTNNFGSGSSPNGDSTDASTPSMNWLDNILYNDTLFNQQLKDGATPGDNALPAFGNTAPGASTLGKPTNYDSNLLSNEFNFDDQFDEQVTDFCVKMNQVCGTRQDPVPKASPSDVSAMTTPSSLGNAVSNSNITIPSSVGSSKKASFGELSFGGANDATPSTTMPFINDALAFPSDSDSVMQPATTTPISSGKTPASVDSNANANANSNGTATNSLGFDANDFFRAPNGSMSLGTHNDMYNQFIRDQDEDRDEADEDEDNLAGLISEEPAQPPMPAAALAKQQEMMARAAATSKKAQADDNDDDDDDDAGIVVPSKDDDLLKCSEIWDRITSHPKYSDIDIDGLCGELMAKAKCSERGVVVNASDVQLALSKHMA